MSKIPIEDKGWQFNPDTCPCDSDFIEYLQRVPASNPINIFHMGPGMHHMVGKWATEQDRFYFVLSVCITPEEVQEYIRLTTENPFLATRYWVLFSDIHLLHPNLMGSFDYISLFHLGEISSQLADDGYPGRGIEQIIDSLSRRMWPGGSMLFFENSVAWKAIAPIVDSFLIEKNWVFSRFKSLIIYTQPE